MKLLGKTVLVYDLRPVEERQGLIALPSDRHIPAAMVKATVYCIGNKVFDNEVNAGDTVLVKSEWGTKLFVEGKESRIYNYEDIMGKVID